MHYFTATTLSKVIEVEQQGTHVVTGLINLLNVVFCFHRRNLHSSSQACSAQLS
jgi:hypothetical protein